MDLIDFQSMPDGNFKYLATYKDHGCKLVDCCPLTSKTHAAVAHFLFRLFTKLPIYLFECKFLVSLMRGERVQEMDLLALTRTQSFEFCG